MRLKNLIALIGAAILGLAAPSIATASSIKISDGSVTVIVNDGGAGDSNPVDGAVTFIGAVGSWIVNVATGVTTPVIGTEIYPEMHLDDLSISGAAVGTLTIWFSETGFGPATPSAGAFAGFGGTSAAGATLTYTSYYGSSLFEEGSLLTSLAFSGGAANLLDSASLPQPADDYSLTQKVTIKHVGGAFQSSSFNATLKVPDGGMTLSLLGLSMVGLAGLRRFLA